MVSSELSIDEELHGVEPKCFIRCDLDEHGKLRTGWIEQPFLEETQILRDTKDVGFNLLNLLVETAHRFVRGILRDTLCAK
jgi:hypothetical protein